MPALSRQESRAGERWLPSHREVSSHPRRGRKKDKKGATCPGIHSLFQKEGGIMSSIHLITSGKGGVGKSTLAASLGAALSKDGRQIVLVDTDIGLRSQDLFLNLESRVVFDLLDVTTGRCLLTQALLESPDLPGLFLLPAAQFARCKDLEPKKLRRVLSLLQQRFDFVLIDCPAGLERGLRNVLNACASDKITPSVLLVVTPDDLCIRAAERVASLLDAKGLPRPQLLVNRLSPDLIRSGDMYTAQTIAALLDLPLLGEIPEDPGIRLAQLRRRPLLAFDCEARSAILRIASRMAMDPGLPDSSLPALPAYGSSNPSLFRRVCRRLFPRKLKEVRL